MATPYTPHEHEHDDPRLPTNTLHHTSFGSFFFFLHLFGFTCHVPNGFTSHNGQLGSIIGLCAKLSRFGLGAALDSPSDDDS
jgi:hypothetical protein